MPDVIVITTNKSPWDWYNYNDRDDERQAVFRRVTGCYRFDKSPDGKPSPKEVDIENANAFLIKRPADKIELKKVDDSPPKPTKKQKVSTIGQEEKKLNYQRDENGRISGPPIYHCTGNENMEVEDEKKVKDDWYWK